MTIPSGIAWTTNNALTVLQERQGLQDNESAMGELLGGAAESTLTLDSGGAITPTSASHKVDTYLAAATDDLIHINIANHPEGRLLLLRSADASRVVTLKHAAGGIGQILLKSGKDITLYSQDMTILLQHNGSSWEERMLSVPQNPNTSVHAYLAAPQSLSLSSGEASLVLFDQESRDTLNEFDTATWTWTAKYPGLYAVAFEIVFEATSVTAGDTYSLLISSNTLIPPTLTYNTIIIPVSNAGSFWYACSGVFQVPAGKLVTTWLRNLNATTKTPTLYAGAASTSLSISWLAPLPDSLLP